MQTHGVPGIRSETGGKSDIRILRLEHAGDGPVAGEGAWVPYDPGAVPPLKLVAALRANIGPLVLGVEMARQALGQSAQRQLGPRREVAEEAATVVITLGVVPFSDGPRDTHLVLSTIFKCSPIWFAPEPGFIFPIIGDIPISVDISPDILLTEIGEATPVAEAVPHPAPVPHTPPAPHEYIPHQRLRRQGVAQPKHRIECSASEFSIFVILSIAHQCQSRTLVAANVINILQHLFEICCYPNGSGPIY